MATVSFVKLVTSLMGGVGCLGMGSVAIGHKALGISELPERPNQQKREIVLRWVDKLRKVAVPNATIRQYFPETYNKRIASRIAANWPNSPQQISNQEAVNRARREIRVLD
ncbi:hypothetical protein WJX82_011423 [Trebouxia sp. C0006]